MNRGKVGTEAALAAILGPLVLLSLRIIKTVTGFIVSAASLGFLVGLIGYLSVKAKRAEAVPS